MKLMCGCLSGRGQRPVTRSILAPLEIKIDSSAEFDIKAEVIQLAEPAAPIVSNPAAAAWPVGVDATAGPAGLYQPGGGSQPPAGWEAALPAKYDTLDALHCRTLGAPSFILSTISEDELDEGLLAAHHRGPSDSGGGVMTPHAAGGITAPYDSQAGARGCSGGMGSDYRFEGGHAHADARSFAIILSAPLSTVFEDCANEGLASGGSCYSEELATGGADARDNAGSLVRGLSAPANSVMAVPVTPTGGTAKHMPAASSMRGRAGPDPAAGKLNGDSMAVWYF